MSNAKLSQKGEDFVAFLSRLPDDQLLAICSGAMMRKHPDARDMIRYMLQLCSTLVATLDEDTQIEMGGFINIAFAVWDGKKDVSGAVKEKGSQKAVSSWWNFRAEAPPNYTGYYYAAIAVGLALGFQFFLIRNLKKGNRA